jgi:transposase InsO family protein
MNAVIEAVGTSKQAFTQMLKRSHYREEERQQLLPLINEIRKDHPRMSARDMYIKLRPSTMGRDQFERFCFASGYRVKRLKNYRVTTNSQGVTRFPNRIKDIKLTGINQVFVSDITYYEIGSKFYYLTLIMDLFNREIVGWSASDNLRTESTTLAALHRLIRERGKANLKGAIIHSDGGGQYYCTEFKTLTKSLEMINSMTEESVYENSHAERLNGVIKNNYLYLYGPKDLISLRKLLEKAVWMYNTGKPHTALGKLTPRAYLNKITIDTENNSQKSYFPLSTVYHKHKLSNQISKKKVNVI